MLSRSLGCTCRMRRVADAMRDRVGAGSCAILGKESENDDRCGEFSSYVFPDEETVVVTGRKGDAAKIRRVGQERTPIEDKMREFGVCSLATT